MPTTAIAANERTRVGDLDSYGYSRYEIELIKSMIAPGSTDAELRLFLARAQHMQLDPFSKQIYAIQRKEYDSDAQRYVAHMSIEVSIDGYRKIAASTGEYEGQIGPLWCGPDGVWHDVWLGDGFPAAAKVGVWRSGFREPIYGVATWASYAQLKADGKPRNVWASHPDIMLAVRAEGLALKRSFPAQLSGVYLPGEVSDEADEPAPLIELASRASTQPKLAAPKATSAKPANGGTSTANAGATQAKPRDAQLDALWELWAALKAYATEQGKRAPELHPDLTAPALAQIIDQWQKKLKVEAASLIATPAAESTIVEGELVSHDEEARDASDESDMTLDEAMS